jgi:hypothetical protein
MSALSRRCPGQQHEASQDINSMPNAAETKPEIDNRRIAARSWGEMNVRPWLVLALMMTVVTAGLASAYLTRVARDRRLIAQGTAVDATVLEIGVQRERQASREEVQRVKIRYVDPKSSRTIESLGELSRKPGASVRLNETLPIRIDPDNPTTWTDRTQPVPISAEMTVPLMLAPIVVLCWILAAWQVRRVRRVLRGGQTSRAAVVSVKQPALAPMSKQIGVALETDRRVRQFYWPNRNGPVAPGDTIDVVATPGGLVLPLKSYQ